MLEFLDNTVECNCSIPPVFPDIKWLSLCGYLYGLHCFILTEIVRGFVMLIEVFR